MSKSNSLQLTQMKKNQEGVISKLNTKNKNILRKLMLMGILPGMSLRVIQAFPSYVLQVGYTQVALDNEIASVIKVNI